MPLEISKTAQNVSTICFNPVWHFWWPFWRAYIPNFVCHFSEHLSFNVCTKSFYDILWSFSLRFMFFHTLSRSSEPGTFSRRYSGECIDPCSSDTENGTKCHHPPLLHQTRWRSGFSQTRVQSQISLWKWCKLLISVFFLYSWYSDYWSESNVMSSHIIYSKAMIITVKICLQPVNGPKVF